MIFSAKNTKLTLNGLDIIATQCALDIATTIDPRYDAGQRHSQSYFASNGVGSSMSFSHYLTGDLDKIKEFISDQGEKIGSDQRSNEGRIISGSFGGLTFTSGYLQTYSIQFNPNSPVIANSTVVFFDDLKGEFSQTDARVSEQEILNCKNITIENLSSTGVGSINDFINASYNFSVDINPVYKAGQTLPDRIYFGRKSVSMGIEVDNPTGYLPYNGVTSKFKLNLSKHNSSTATENFSCFGVLQSRSVRTSVDDKVSHMLQILTNNPKVTSNVFGIEPRPRPVFVGAGGDDVGVPLNVL
tara:strand:+ start:736 stop:1635 length:900 start_codon:yes stop_codon:yes gene_type:complete